MSGGRMTVIFVCTGNTCRSPMAAALLRRALLAAGTTDIEVTSAGTGAWEGAPVSEGAYLVALEQDLDLSAHRARLLSRELVDGADLILAMGRTHLARVRELGGGSRAHLLGAFAGRSGPEAEISDPYGGDLDDYRETFRLLAALMPMVAARLAGGAR
jgi:protein-tyrosine-phosphatase